MQQQSQGTLLRLPKSVLMRKIDDRLVHKQRMRGTNVRDIDRNGSRVLRFSQIQNCKAGSLLIVILFLKIGSVISKVKFEMQMTLLTGFLDVKN